jgi:hypothetical protein
MRTQGGELFVMLTKILILSKIVLIPKQGFVNLMTVLNGVSCTIILKKMILIKIILS